MPAPVHHLRGGGDAAQNLLIPPAMLLYSRRRECCRCGHRFTTYESVESQPLLVVKRNGSRQNFDKNKIVNSMIRAFDKRKADIVELERIANEIEQAVRDSLVREVTTERLGEMVVERLKPVDEVAYIRFASIYHQFQDASSFMKEISKFLEEK